MQLLAGLGPLGVPELLIIALIVILVFGVGRLPEVGGAVGKSIREFRKATKDGEEADAATAVSASTSPQASAPADSWTPGAAPAASAPGAETMFCSECGAKNLRNAKFCSNCGHAIGTPAS